MLFMRHIVRQIIYGKKSCYHMLVNKMEHVLVMGVEITEKEIRHKASLRFLLR